MVPLSRAMRRWCKNMSGSESGSIEISGESSSDDPIEALRDALNAVLKGLVSAGCGPHHLTAMRWETAKPARFHPARYEIELIYREVFVGFRTAVSLRRVARAGVRALATVRPPARTAGDTPVYGGYTLAQLAREYSPRAQADMNAVLKQWSLDGARFRAMHHGLDLAYGTGRFESFDIFMPPGVERPPVWIFIHGGYWQATDKNQHEQFAAGMLAAGFAVAMPNYGLLPETPLSGIFAQLSRFIAFLISEADNLGIDGARLHLSGHSAGAHLAGLIAARDAVPTIRSVLLLSGLFDLAPLVPLPVGKLLKLKPHNVGALSPALLPQPAGLKIALAVGERESDEFKRQSRQLAAAWKAPEPLIVPGHHFSMLDGLNGGALLDLALSVAEGSE